MIIDVCVFVDGEIDFCTKAKKHKGTLSEKKNIEQEIKNGAVFECGFCHQTLEANK